MSRNYIVFYINEKKNEDGNNPLLKTIDTNNSETHKHAKSNNINFNIKLMNI